jgi:cytochrome c553
MKRSALTLSAAMAAVLLCGSAQAQSPADLLAGYVRQAGAAASAERGQKFFNTDFKRDFKGCVECHTTNPTKAGKDTVSEKVIPPLAPAANSKRFTDAAKAEQAFRTNCKDVVGRECTAGEKADILSWLITLKP